MFLSRVQSTRKGNASEGPYETEELLEPFVGPTEVTFCNNIYNSKEESDFL